LKFFYLTVTFPATYLQFFGSPEALGRTVSPHKLSRLLKIRRNGLEWLGKLYVTAIQAPLWLLSMRGCYPCVVMVKPLSKPKSNADSDNHWYNN